MTNTKKYYWLKLKEDFFNEKQIKYLRSLPDGDKLVIVYLKMQLKSLRTEGFIKYDEILPSNVEELAMILDEDVNCVKFTIGALLKVKAIEQLDDGSFYMIAMQQLIGKEGQSAERVRKFRTKQNNKMLQCNTNVTKCNTEIEIEKDIDIEIEQKNTSTKVDNICSTSYEEELLKIEFEKLWKLYPKKVGKEKSFLKYVKYRTSKGNDYTTFDEVLNGLNKYLKYIEQNKWYSPKDALTWFNNRSWNDEYSIKDTPEWLDKDINIESLTAEEQGEMEEMMKGF